MVRIYRRSIFTCKRRICRSLRRRFFVLKAQTFRFLNDRVLDGSEFFLLGKRIVLSRFAFVVALQRITQVIPDGIIRRYLRYFFQFIHDGIHHILEWLFEISILLFTVDRVQLQRKLHELLPNRFRRIFNCF